MPRTVGAVTDRTDRLLDQVTWLRGRMRLEYSDGSESEAVAALSVAQDVAKGAGLTVELERGDAVTWRRPPAST
jgi:hypothetical protein